MCQFGEFLLNTSFHCVPQDLPECSEIHRKTWYDHLLTRHLNLELSQHGPGPKWRLAIWSWKFGSTVFGSA